MALNCAMLLLLSSSTPEKARCLMIIMGSVDMSSAMVMIDAHERVPYAHLPDVGIGHHRTRERSNRRWMRRVCCKIYACVELLKCCSNVLRGQLPRRRVSQHLDRLACMHACYPHFASHF